MDTGKIDAIMREIVMVSIFAILGLLLLLSAANVKVDDKTLTMDGLLPTIVAILGIGLLVFQIRQTNKQIQQYGDRSAQQNRELLIKKFRKSVISCTSNILCSKTNEGCLFLDSDLDYSTRCVVCWRHNHHEETNIHHFNMMFRIMETSESANSVLESLQDTSDLDRWNFRIFIPLFEGTYGNLIQVSNSGYGIDKIDQRSHDCIMHAVNNIQALGHQEMFDCQTALKELSLKSANDSYIDTINIIQYPTIIV